MQSLEELTQYVRQTLPQSKAIVNLRIEQKTGVVRFTWHNREFLVKRSLEVFEAKGSDVFLTGASVLAQTLFKTRERNKKILVAVIETLTQVEDAVKNDVERGLALLVSVKQTLGKLVPKKSDSKPGETAG